MATVQVQQQPQTRLKRIANFDSLQAALDRRLHRGAQYEFLDFYHRHYQGLAPQIIPSHFYWRDAAKVFLHWLLYYFPLRKYRQWGVARTTMLRIINFSHDVMQNFPQAWISFKTLEERQQLSQAHLSPRFAFVTVLVDGTHTPCTVNQSVGERLKNFWSFKLEHGALNTQVAMLASGWIAWVSSSSEPAGANNDSTMMTQHYDDFKSHIRPFEPEVDASGCDYVMADGGYYKFRKDQWLIPHRKPRNGSLTDRQIRANELMANDRALIEHRFAHLKNKWAILEQTYRFSKGKFNLYFQLCCALMNAEIQALAACRENRTLDQEWEHNAVFIFDIADDDLEVARVAEVDLHEMEDGTPFFNPWDLVALDDVIDQPTPIQRSARSTSETAQCSTSGSMQCSTSGSSGHRTQLNTVFTPPPSPQSESSSESSSSEDEAPLSLSRYGRKRKEPERMDL